ncbi:uncharacterized protein LOC126332402 [Schistocerca gregaria]|uniref:uncharacterized protein LOC126332402 n=1 Tax=Schistocerca gregaria TaxID=7010 RepID=UPI00211DCFBA|nr:uncharacterized protein LOC126332402 [Schistocerca gregaria]
MINSLVLMQQFSVILILVTVFFLMANYRISPYYLNLSSLVATVSGLIAYAFASRLYQQRGIMFFLGYSVNFAGYVFGLYISSPLLCSLTDMISDGTISVLSTFLLIVHLIFQDYAYLNYPSTSYERQLPINEDVRRTGIGQSSLDLYSKVLQSNQFNHLNSYLSSITGTCQTLKFSTRLTNSNNSNSPSFLKYRAPVSLNAATLASLMLASRLRTHTQSFSILVLSIILFALVPIFTHHMRQYCSYGKIIIPIFLSVLATFLCYALSNTLTLIFLFIGIFTIFVSPLCMKWMQHYKNEIRGPWDEAIPSTRL